MIVKLLTFFWSYMPIGLSLFAGCHRLDEPTNVVESGGGTNVDFLPGLLTRETREVPEGILRMANAFGDSSCTWRPEDLEQIFLELFLRESQRRRSLVLVGICYQCHDVDAIWSITKGKGGNLATSLGLCCPDSLDDFVSIVRMTQDEFRVRQVNLNGGGWVLEVTFL